MATRKWCGDWCVMGGCGGLHIVSARRFISYKINALRSAASTARCNACQPPRPRAIEGRRGDVRILGGGWASLPALNTLRYRMKTRLRVEGDGSVIIVRVFGGGGSIFTPKERQTPGFRDVVTCANDTPIPLHCQNHDKALTSWQIISHRGRY